MVVIKLINISTKTGRHCFVSMQAYNLEILKPLKFENLLLQNIIFNVKRAPNDIINQQKTIIILWTFWKRCGDYDIRPINFSSFISHIKLRLNVLCVFSISVYVLDDTIMNS